MEKKGGRFATVLKGLLLVKFSNSSGIGTVKRGVKKVER
jgi:hypothetical protein